jgi:hypothetical protein
VVLYNSSFFSGVAKPRILPAGYISTLCKVAARLALTKGKKDFPFNPFRAVGFGPKAAPPKTTARPAKRPKNQPNGRTCFMPLPGGQARAEPPAGRCFAVVLLEGSSIPQTPWIIFLLEARLADLPCNPKRTSIKKTFTFSFSLEIFIK